MSVKVFLEDISILNSWTGPVSRWWPSLLWGPLRAWTEQKGRGRLNSLLPECWAEAWILPPGLNAPEDILRAFRLESTSLALWLSDLQNTPPLLLCASSLQTADYGTSQPLYSDPIPYDKSLYLKNTYWGRQHLKWRRLPWLVSLSQ